MSDGRPTESADESKGARHREVSGQWPCRLCRPSVRLAWKPTHQARSPTKKLHESLAGYPASVVEDTGWRARGCMWRLVEGDVPAAVGLACGVIECCRTNPGNRLNSTPIRAILCRFASLQSSTTADRPRPSTLVPPRSQIRCSIRARARHARLPINA